MEWTLTYILSQAFVIIMYALLGATYFVKNRKALLILSFISLISNGIAFIFLGAYTGLAMVVVALLRNVIFLLDEKKNGKKDKINEKDIIILILLYIISIVSAIFTYDGALSLLSVLATMLYTYSVWQKKTNVYKLLGIPIGVLWILYNIYIISVFGIVLETILLVCSTTGYILSTKSIRENRKK